jgi:hypothetical protein
MLVSILSPIQLVLLQALEFTVAVFITILVYQFLEMEDFMVVCNQNPDALVSEAAANLRGKDQ